MESVPLAERIEKACNSNAALIAANRTNDLALRGVFRRGFLQFFSAHTAKLSMREMPFLSTLWTYAQLRFFFHNLFVRISQNFHPLSICSTPQAPYPALCSGAGVASAENKYSKSIPGKKVSLILKACGNEKGWAPLILYRAVLSCLIPVAEQISRTVTPYLLISASKFFIVSSPFY